MLMSIIIADSGSTKTDWLIADTSGNTPIRITSSGFNPCLMDDDTITHILQHEVAPHIPASPSRIFFYGAGCRPDQTERMASLLTLSLNAASAHVFSDLLGAAHALCGHTPGIVVILGTGSGSAVYDGCQFVAQTPSLGYILGDEGSGAVLGRQLLSDLLKGQLSPSLTKAFYEDYPDFTLSETIEHVYRNTAPNRFLAQFTRFLSAHRQEDEIHALLVNEFRRFFVRNIRPYARPDLAVNCVGSIASVFEPELREAAAAEGFTIGTILRSPIEVLATYCAQEQNCQ